MTPTPRERPLSTARELLDSATAELAPKPHANPLVPLVADGAADRRALAALALEQCRVIPADRRSFLHLAARSADAGLPACAAFFAALAEGEEVALDRLGPLLTACGVDAEQAAAYVPTAGCQAYPAYVAWLALNAEPADAVLALTANFAAWGGYCGALARALRLDTEVMLVDDPVKRVDNMTMAHGLEARVPFLDHEFVELAARVPAELKLAQDGKGVLKDAARGVIPDAVIDREKGYFPVPALRHLEGPYLEMVRDALSAPTARARAAQRRRPAVPGPHARRELAEAALRVRLRQLRSMW